MSKILVQLTKTATPLPTGVVFGHTNVSITDSSGTPQVFALNGSESPPWSVTATVADGTGSVVATDVDSNGNTIGSPLNQSFTTIEPTFPATSGITVTPS